MKQKLKQGLITRQGTPVNNHQTINKW